MLRDVLAMAGRHRYDRKPGNRSRRSIIGILTEGSVTEVEYIKHVRQRLGIPKENVRIFESDHTDPKGLVAEAVKMKKENEKESKHGEPIIEHWWVVVDTETQHGRSGLSDAVQQAKGNGIWLCQNSLSFEFWLLLHFEYTTRNFNSVKDLIGCLRRKCGMGSYNPGMKHPDMEALFPLIETAKRNASKLRRNHTRKGCKTPCTDFDLLVQDIERIAKRNCQEGCKEPDFGDLSMNID